MSSMNWLRRFFQKSQILNFILAFLAIWGLYSSLARFDDIVKLIGAPFGVMPDMLGMTERVKKEDVQEFRIYANDAINVQIKDAGNYYIFTSFFYDWRVGPIIYIESSDGSLSKVLKGPEKPRFYDTIYARGAPTYKFTVTEAGDYVFHFKPKPGGEMSEGGTPLDREYRIGIAPDYITGNEEIYAKAYLTQFIVLVFICLIIAYYVYFRPRRRRVQQEKIKRENKRHAFDEFMSKK